MSTRLSRPASGRFGCGVVGPLSGGSRDAGLGVMRAPGSGVRVLAACTRDGGGGVYHVADASFGHPVGSHGTNMLVACWYAR
jgi:hypothetical protein